MIDFTRTAPKAPTASEALCARVRNKLRTRGRLFLRKSRTEDQRITLGDFWIEDSLGILPIATHVDLRDVARRLQLPPA